MSWDNYADNDDGIRFHRRSSVFDIKGDDLFHPSASNDLFPRRESSERFMSSVTPLIPFGSAINSLSRKISNDYSNNNYPSSSTSFSIERKPRRFSFNYDS